MLAAPQKHHQVKILSLDCLSKRCDLEECEAEEDIADKICLTVFCKLESIKELCFIIF